MELINTYGITLIALDGAKPRGIQGFGVKGSGLLRV